MGAVYFSWHPSDNVLFYVQYGETGNLRLFDKILFVVPGMIN